MSKKRYLYIANSATDAAYIDVDRVHDLEVTSATAFNIDHNLGTRNVIVQLYDSSSYETVYAQVVRSTTNRVVLTFNVAPTNDDVVVLVNKID